MFIPTIQFFKKTRSPIEVEDGANLRESLLNHQVPVASSCSGEAVCSKCWIKIIVGADHVSKATEEESNLRISSVKPLSSEERLSCKTLVHGDILIDTNYW